MVHLKNRTEHFSVACGYKANNITSTYDPTHVTCEGCQTAMEPRHRDLDTIDLDHDLGTKWLTDPWER